MLGIATGLPTPGHAIVSCPADYILQGQFGQEADRRGVAPLGLRERRGLGFQAETEPLRLHQVVITSKPYASTPSKSTTAADLVTGHRAALPPSGGFAGSGAGGSSLVLALCPRRALTAGG